MTRLRLIGITTIVLLLFSCGNNNSEYFNTIQKSEEGHLRGVSIGMSIDSVKVKESAKALKNEMPDYLHYDYIIDMGNSYTVAYDFSQENRLYEIEMSVFFDKIEDAGTLYQDFSEKFSSRYGQGNMEEDGFMIWKTVAANQNVEFAMKDDSQTYGYLSIIIRDLDY